MVMTLANPAVQGTTNPAVFSLPRPFAGRAAGTVASWVIRPLEKASGLQALNRLYRSLPATTTPHEFCARALEMLEIDIRVSAEDLARIPQSGPVMLVANHPFGAIEGIVLGKLLGDIRPDFKFMANFLLARIPEMRDILISVDPFGGRGAGARNIGPLRQCLSWMRQGGALGVFPSGEVAHLKIDRRPTVTDPAWNPNIGGLARRAGAAVVPVYFSGRNTATFQAAGLVHPALRTALLPRQLLNKRGSTIELRIGQQVPAERIANFSSDSELTEYLRFRTFLLHSRGEPEKGGGHPSLLSGKSRQEPVAAADPAELLHEEVKNLSPKRLMTETDDFAVYCVNAGEIPLLLREIGRLREITFRGVGEGTGKRLDLDRFDAHYQHLIVWSKKNRELVGAYRIGKVNRILHQQGVAGLYTHTLFNYSPELLANLGYSFELGRSFVRPEYQRSFSPLLLLWKGIGRLVARNPEYKNLIGPVSISNDYTAVSRQLLAAYLMDKHQPAALAEGVAARHPLRLVNCGGIDPRAGAHFIGNMDEISALIAGIEHDGKGAPILLRQYLKLGGVILGLNVDKQFGNCLDGLILVDLSKTEPRLLEKYMEKEGAAAFLAWHHRGNHAGLDPMA